MTGSPEKEAALTRDLNPFTETGAALRRARLRKKWAQIEEIRRDEPVIYGPGRGPAEPGAGHQGCGRSGDRRSRRRRQVVRRRSWRRRRHYERCPVGGGRSRRLAFDYGRAVASCGRVTHTSLPCFRCRSRWAVRENDENRRRRREAEGLRREPPTKSWPSGVHDSAVFPMHFISAAIIASALASAHQSVIA